VVRADDGGEGGCKSATLTQSGPIETGGLSAVASEGVKLTNARNSMAKLEAADTSSGNVEVDNTGSLDVSTASAPGKGKVSITLEHAQAGLAASGQIGAGTISLKADQMNLSGGTVLSRGSATLAPVSAAQPIDLGTKESNTLGLTSADINAVSAKKLAIGGTKAGPITVSAAMAPANTHDLTLETPSAIEASGGGSLSVSTLSLMDKEPEPGATWTITPSSVGQGANPAVPYSTATKLQVAGGKTFDVTASAATKYALTGSAKRANGTLDYDAQGRTVSGSPSPPKGVIDSPGVKPVHFAGMTAVNISDSAS